MSCTSVSFRLSIYFAIAEERVGSAIFPAGWDTYVKETKKETKITEGNENVGTKCEQKRDGPCLPFKASVSLATLKNIR